MAFRHVIYTVLGFVFINIIKIITKILVYVNISCIFTL